MTDTATKKTFGTFSGVFRPTVLTILGALLYLREGWVVGHAGLGGFILILLGMYAVTAPTALAMSSMTSNIRIGQGGVFSIVSQSMGLEAGGAIGVPFYVAQSLSAAMYLYAFAEAWRLLFPTHPLGLVALCAFGVAALLSTLSARIAFKTQSVVMFGTLAAFVSMAVGVAGADGGHVIEFYHRGSGDTSLGALFALFFPAATGVLVGASMSGSLKDPRRSIPRGTLAAVGVSFAVYLVAGVWYAVIASPEELRTNLAVAFERSAWSHVVIGGVLASTFSATLSSLVAAPRVLQALAAYGIVPLSHVLSKASRSGEPRAASLVTACIVGVGLATGSLDAIAPLLTVFFLITYASVNIVVLVEQWLGLPSFRPTFRIPVAAPALGGAAALVAILVTSPVVGLAALSFVLALYAWLVRRRLPAPFETARSGLVVNIAAWAARKIGELPSSTERSWKPDLLVPVQSAAELAGSYTMLRAIAGSKGSLHILGLSDRYDYRQLSELDRLAEDFVSDGVNAKATWAQSTQFGESVAFSMSVLHGAFLPPNIVFTSALDRTESDLKAMAEVARQKEFGVVIRVPHEVAGLGQERQINVWVRDQSPDWALSLKMASIDLSLLIALQIRERWAGRIRLLTAVSTEDSREGATSFLAELWVQARVPGTPDVDVHVGAFESALAAAPHADLNVFGLPQDIRRDALQATASRVNATCLFVLASGKESALA